MKKIADDLADLYHEKAAVSIELSHLEQDKEARILALTPLDDVWPGKNEDACRVARDRVCAVDEVLKDIAMRQRPLTDEMLRLEGGISALQVEFQASRWEVRRAHVELVRALLSASDRVNQVVNIDVDNDIDDLPF